MKDTEQLIQRLAENIQPTRPLGRPWARTGVWLAVSVPYMAVALLVIVVRNGMPSSTLDVRFIVEIVSGFAAGIAAAMCAFGSVVPGFNRRLIIWMVLPLAVWLGSVSEGCIQEWVRQGAQSLSLNHDLSCLPVIALLSLFPVAALVLMLRRGAPLMPHLTAALGGLAAAGLGNLGLRLVFPEDANVGLLVWHVGGVFLLATLSGSAGHYFLNWRSIR